MTANEATAHRLLLRKSPFDEAADRAFGSEAKDWQIAEHLGIDPATLSLYRNGHRQPPTTFVAKVLATFPNLKFEDLFERVTEPVQAAS